MDFSAENGEVNPVEDARLGVVKRRACAGPDRRIFRGEVGKVDRWHLVHVLCWFQTTRIRDLRVNCKTRLWRRVRSIRQMQRRIRVHGEGWKRRVASL